MTNEIIVRKVGNGWIVVPCVKRDEVVAQEKTMVFQTMGFTPSVTRLPTLLNWIAENMGHE